MAPCKDSWKKEYIRLYYHTPRVESEVLKEHRDQVLHVSYSHDGKLFATTSKDGYIKVSAYELKWINMKFKLIYLWLKFSDLFQFYNIAIIYFPVYYFLTKFHI